MQNHQQMASQKSAILQSYSSKSHLNAKNMIKDYTGYHFSLSMQHTGQYLSWIYISTLQCPSKEYLSIQKSYNLKVTTCNPLKEQAIVSVTWASRGSIFAAFLKNSWAFSVCPSWTCMCPRTYRRKKSSQDITDSMKFQ